MREDWKYWIALSKVSGLGGISIKNLFNEFQSAEAIFKASKKDLKYLDGINDKQIESIKGFNDWDEVDKEIDQIEKRQLKLIPLIIPNIQFL